MVKDDPVSQSRDAFRPAEVTEASCFPRPSAILLVVLFLGSWLLLFLGSTRFAGAYDEGFVLVAAMRAMAGQVPHRDFYYVYGPAQYFILAALFKLFGPSIFVARLFDLALKAATVVSIYWMARAVCRGWMAEFAGLIAFLWIFGLALNTSALTPVALLALWSTWFILPVFTSGPTWRWTFAAGLMTGLVELFRYDLGLPLMGLQMALLATALLRRNHIAGRNQLRAAISSCLVYAAGFALVVLPPVLLYLSVASFRDFLLDLFIYGGKNYRPGRGLPFPAVHFHNLEDLGIYVPILILILCLFALRHGWRNRPQPAWLGFMLSFTLVGGLLYFKGIVRVSNNGMYLSLICCLVLLVFLADLRAELPKFLRGPVLLTSGLVCFISLVAAGRQAESLIRHRSSVLGRIISPSSQHPQAAQVDWCSDHDAPLTRGFCFLVDSDHIAATQFLRSHTQPKDVLLIGVPHHDHIFASDNMAYFATWRLPATRWSQYDPDLQNTGPVQEQIIADLQRNPPPYIVLDAEFEKENEPNDSSKSSGVTLLDDFIHSHYEPAESFGVMSIWARTGVPGPQTTEPQSGR